MDRDSPASSRPDPVVFSPGVHARPFPRRYVTTSVGSAFVALHPIGAEGPSTRSLVTLPGLVARTASEPTLPVDALIFHCSRCGSTLLARLLALNPANRVFAEPDVLVKFVWRHRAALARGEFVRELRGFVRGFGLEPQPHERRLILKLSSHAIAHLPAWRAAFPHTPFYYLFREPGEVIASLLANAPGFLRPESRPLLAALWDEPAPDFARQSESAWATWYVARNLRSAHAHRAEFATLVDYANHPHQYLQLVESISGERLSPEMPAVKQTLGSYSKNPSHRFDPKFEGKRDGQGKASANASLHTMWRELCADNNDAKTP